MNATSSGWREAVGSTLETLGAPAQQINPVRWRVPARDGHPGFSAALGRVWLTLVFDGGDGPAAARDPLALAAENAALPPLFQRNGTLRAAIPLTETRRIGGVLARVLGSLGDDSAPAAATRHGGDPVGTGDGPVAELALACGQAGWPTTPREHSAVAVELDCRRGHFQAEIACERLGVRARVGLFESDDGTRPGALAAAQMLCAAAADVPLARPYVAPAGPGLAMGFETLIHAPPHAGELAAALSCLSIAADACGPELLLLGDDAFASAYLAFANAPGQVALGETETTTERNAP